MKKVSYIERRGNSEVYYNSKPSAREGFELWCTKVDELLNSIVDETNVINEWQ